MLSFLAAMLLPVGEPTLRTVADLIRFDVAQSKRIDPTLDVQPENDPTRRALASKALFRALSKYPSVPLRNHLRAIFVVHRLRYDGTEMGATNRPLERTIWIEVGDPAEDGNWIEDSLHHELAHLLADTHRDDLPEAAWRAANARDFHYTDADGGFAAVASGRHTSLALVPTLNAKGVLSEYGATEFDEDWATFAERVLHPDPQFRATFQTYPRIRTKVRLLTGYYRRRFSGIQLNSF